MKINSLFYRSRRSSFLKNKNSTSYWKSLSLKVIFSFLTAAAVFSPAFLVRAEIIIGIIEKYNPQRKQATINLGKKDGIGKYDRGKIELTSLDSPNVRFIGANVVVISVDENSAVVSVREAPGVQVPLQAGARVTVDTGSGLARREEEAKLLATQEAQQARRQRQLEQARAEQARRQRQLEQERAEQARRQQQLEQERTEQARRQQQLEQERAQQARRQQQLEQKNTSIQQEPEDISLKEARELWRNSSPEDIQNGSISDLPSDYLKAYIAARRQPSPETYYQFARVLIDYDISDKALTWLEETQSRFPLTKAVNNFYRAVALASSGKIEQGQNLLDTSGMPSNQFIEELRSYLYTHKGMWNRVFSLSETSKSAITYNNYLIGLYCTRPPAPNRNTNIPVSNCPFGNAVSIQPQHYQDLTTLREISQDAIAKYPKNSYILNTLGFLALHSEDYNRAYDYYQQLAKVLDKYDTTPPHLQLLKANAINYVNNYNQNYEFLTSRTQNLQLLRSQQDSLTSLILLDGAGDIVTRLDNGISSYGIAARVLSTLVRLRKSRIQARRIARERDSILDQMRLTFTRDINLVPARPELEPESLLKLSATRIENQLIRYNNFWNCQCPTSNSLDSSRNLTSPLNQESICYKTCRSGDRPVENETIEKLN